MHAAQGHEAEWSRGEVTAQRNGRAAKKKRLDWKFPRQNSLSTLDQSTFL